MVYSQSRRRSFSSCQISSSSVPKAAIPIACWLAVALVFVLHRTETPPSQQDSWNDHDPYLAIRQKLAAAYSSEGHRNDTIPAKFPASPAYLSLAQSERDELAENIVRDVVSSNVNFTFRVNYSSFCRAALQKTLVLVIVHSAPAHFRNRQLIRETWASPLWRHSQNFTVFFLLGSSPTRLVEEKISQESALHGDIVQYDYLDTYRNLTYKNLAGLSFLTQSCLQGRYDYLLKTDDDMFVYMRPIVSFLRQEKFCKRSLYRTILCAAFQRKEIVQRSKDTKWFSKWSEYEEKYYPPYCYGGGYILTADLLSPLLEASRKIPYYWIDDVFVTGMAARRMKDEGQGQVTHVQLPRQYPIQGYNCAPACMKKRHRWFMHTLQKIDMLQSYYRPLKNEGMLSDPSSSTCSTTTKRVAAKN